MKLSNLACIGSILCFYATTLKAENFGSVSSAGNIASTGGSINSQASFVRAQTYFYTPGYLQTGTNALIGGYITAGSNISAGGYISASGAGYFGDFVRIGGGSTPAARSVQIGFYATASSFNSLVVGQYNKIEGTAGSWNGTVGALEPLLVAGNGANAGATNNAFAVYKDGTVTMSKAQGDISMGQFGN